LKVFSPKKKHTRRQDFDKDSYFINGSLYIYHKSILEEKKPTKHKEGYYIMKKINSFDIDDLEDLEIVKKILKK
jgi:CMP-N-acetylneuraminic acid synthetase